MTKAVAQWFISAFVNWQQREDAHKTNKEFAEFLDLGEKALSSYMTGRANPSYKVALKVATRTDNYEILSMLGYTRPDENQFDQLPDPFRSASKETLAAIHRRGAAENSDDAFLIAIAVFEKFGFKYQPLSK